MGVGEVSLGFAILDHLCLPDVAKAASAAIRITRARLILILPQQGSSQPPRTCTGACTFLNISLHLLLASYNYKTLTSTNCASSGRGASSFAPRCPPQILDMACTTSLKAARLGLSVRRLPELCALSSSNRAPLGCSPFDPVAASPADALSAAAGWRSVQTGPCQYRIINEMDG